MWWVYVLHFLKLISQSLIANINTSSTSGSCNQYDECSISSFFPLLPIIRVNTNKKKAIKVVIKYGNQHLHINLPVPLSHTCFWPIVTFFGSFWLEPRTQKILRFFWCLQRISKFINIEYISKASAAGARIRKKKFYS